MKKTIHNDPINALSTLLKTVRFVELMISKILLTDNKNMKVEMSSKNFYCVAYVFLESYTSRELPTLIPIAIY
jgi:hypothetical protein